MESSNQKTRKFSLTHACMLFDIARPIWGAGMPRASAFVINYFYFLFSLPFLSTPFYTLVHPSYLCTIWTLQNGLGGVERERTHTIFAYIDRTQAFEVESVRPNTLHQSIPDPQPRLRWTNSTAQATCTSERSDQGVTRRRGDKQ